MDDHVSFRRAAAALLQALGAEVVGEAEDGEGAVRAAAALSPDVVLLDVGLPDSDGFAVAARIVAADPARAVVLTSTRDSSDYGGLVAGSAARGFITKSELSGPALAAVLG